MTFIAFVEGRRLVLGGVEVPSERGLLGHSDADVLAHALMDAMLGAMRGGDIGQLFPDNDPAYKDADSMVLLSRVAGAGSRAGLSNLGLRLYRGRPVAQALPVPARACRMRMAEAMGVGVECVGVKATTTEGLGFVGREEGICAWAYVCLSRSSSPLP